MSHGLIPSSSKTVGVCHGSLVSTKRSSTASSGSSGASTVGFFCRQSHLPSPLSYWLPAGGSDGGGGGGGAVGSSDPIGAATGPAFGLSALANRGPLRALQLIGSPSAHAGTSVMIRLNSSMLPTPSGSSHTISSCTCKTTGHPAASSRS